MLRRLSRLFQPELVMAITPEGVALGDKTNTVNLLKLPGELTPESLASLLIQQASTLDGKTIELVMSHHYVHFAVLPWHHHVWLKRDWLSLARLHFENVSSGALANWHYVCDDSRFGVPMPIAAINPDIVSAVTSSCIALNASLLTISPWMPLDAGKSQWLLTVEEDCMHLFRSEHQSWTQVWRELVPQGYVVERMCQIWQEIRLQHPEWLAQEEPVIEAYTTCPLLDAQTSNLPFRLQTVLNQQHPAQTILRWHRGW